MGLRLWCHLYTKTPNNTHNTNKEVNQLNQLIDYTIGEVLGDRGY